MKERSAVGGTIIEIDLRRAHGNYRVSRVGFATFADQMAPGGFEPPASCRLVRPIRSSPAQVRG